MNKHIYAFLFVLGMLFSFSNQAKAQLYFPPADFSQYMDWIDYNKVYYKVIVNEDGIYRIGFQEIIDAGIPVSINPNRLQMYYHGQEIPIRVEGENDGRLDSLDYIEFYGKERDSEHDKLLYPDPTQRPTQEISLYGKNSVYFLTYTLSPAETGLRMQTFYEANTQNLIPEPYHLQYQTNNYSSQYVAGPLYPLSFLSYEGRGCIVSDFEGGKGKSGAVLRRGQGAIQALDGLPIIDYVADSIQNSEFGFGAMGLSNLNHRVRFYYGLAEASITNEFLEEREFKNYEIARVSKIIPDSLGIMRNGVVGFYMEDMNQPAGFGVLSYTGCYIKYPQATKMNEIGRAHV